MIRAIILISVIGFAAAATAQTEEKTGMPAPIVFFDIAGPDLAGQRMFYEAVLGLRTDASGRFEAPAVAPSIPALLRTDPRETVIYFGVDDIDATLHKVIANGGKVHAPRFAVPGVAILGLFIDPAGNRVGLVEIKGGQPVVP